MRLTPKGNPDEVDPVFKEDFLFRAGRAAEAAIIGGTPFDEGELQASWELTVSEDGFVVGSRLDYASYPEFGTDGPIYPKNGEFLVFVSRGVKYVVRKVEGQAAQRFMLNALRQVFPDANIIER